MLYVKQRAAARKGQRDGRPRTGLLDLPDAVLALILRLAAKPAPSGRGPADSTAEESFDECACASLFDEERCSFQEAARTALLERVCRRFRRALREPCTIERISLNCGKKDKDGRPAALACFSGRAPDWAALRAVELREIPAGPGPAATAEAVAAALALCPALEELRVELEWCAGPPPAALEAVLAALPAMPGLRRLELALSEGCLAAAPADLLRIAALPRLESLRLSGVPLAHEQLAALASSRGGTLRALHAPLLVPPGGLAGPLLAPLASLPLLQCLEISFRSGATGMETWPTLAPGEEAPLGRLPRLRSLRLRARLSALSFLSGPPPLEALDLRLAPGAPAAEIDALGSAGATLARLVLLADLPAGPGPAALAAALPRLARLRALRLTCSAAAAAALADAAAPPALRAARLDAGANPLRPPSCGASSPCPPSPPSPPSRPAPSSRTPPPSPPRAPGAARPSRSAWAPWRNSPSRRPPATPCGGSGGGPSASPSTS
eukprot:tig00000145_g8807.t1